MPVSYPPLDPRINRELFQTQNLPFPYDNQAAAGGNDDDDSDSEDNVSDALSSAADSDDDDGVGAHQRANQPFGAGFGPITGVGSSMNHVVRIAWSPSGLGLNRRPILAILTGSGTLAMYGDDSAVANILPRANEGMLQRRELISWSVLWGVGERLMVPGQQLALTENIHGFAWAKEIAPGQALLATINDQREVALISVQSMLKVDETRSKSNISLLVESKESLVWYVNEVARFQCSGPHPKGNVMAPDWVPFGTSFGINFSPWVEEGDGRSCLLSYVDRNYVGFRKVTLASNWKRGELPEVKFEETDTYGRCLHLSTDSFVEFEDAVWNAGRVKYCRGFIVTGFDYKPFEVALVGGEEYSCEPHGSSDCGTTYMDEAVDQPSTNPIIDLVIHRPDLKKQTPVPLFTLIRMSATSTNLDWYETNVPALPGEVATSINEDSDLVNSPSETHEPQWVTQVLQKLAVSVPADMHFKRGYGDDDDVSVASDESDEDEDLDDDDFYGNDDDNTIDMTNNGKDAMAVAPEVPEIHPHRFRLHGLTVSSGGNVTAMIASLHSTQHPERGGWHTVRSTVFFGTKPRKRGATLPFDQADQVQEATEKEKERGAEEAIDPALRGPERPLTPSPVTTRNSVTKPAEPQQSQSRLTTEARLFEWLYGGGDEVPGVTVNHPSNLVNLNAPEHQFPQKLNTLFAYAIARQQCDLCGARILPPATKKQQHSQQQQQKDKRSGLSGCENGHFFSVCTTSGLAIQMPGITRNCGACGSRTMRAEILARKCIPPNPRFSDEDKQHDEQQDKDKDGDVEMREGEGDADARPLTEEEQLDIKRKNAEKRIRGEIIAMLGDGICGGCGGKFLN
ncbi:hypothetical protein GE21DRAFT_6430 [Neurospora crassa]|uniref:Transcription factor IIIC putative zinc-finger domain-containing protein n=1 Tax=Neurospora crassa (strain ATCC 24698 / 74-OR23-1A / CBS 708.71 / DSM 1257 / FGSC 987) TaxID=367110 RepID=Q7S955_NEUCR|nr:hypothetical protein NCU07260 [Neurospora crassa OR74A]EAA32878.2 hypothetical protein NCU07260 [Neurospora crassa OR74A]KHE88680.1 hypothetical protein GE21DRAFT_6430 [Neurospora crassa]|eukprot:XP_962114.2 hypothetical protein NCU07260 [Neurospora crassa OR74A]